IVVAADHERAPLFFELLEPGDEVVEELHLEKMALFACGAVGEVEVHEGEALRESDIGAAFLVVELEAHGGAEVGLLVGGERHRAGIALLHGAAPGASELMETGIFQQFHLLRMSFALLEAEEVGVHLLHYLVETFAEAGADAVDVPRYDAGHLLAY